MDPATDQSFHVALAAQTPVTPVLAAIPDQAVSALSTLTFVAGVTNAGLLSAPLTYGLDGEPAGAEINPVSGTFVWTPAADQDGIHTFTVTVTDSGGGTDSQTVTVTVNPTGAPPDIPVNIGAASTVDSVTLTWDEPGDDSVTGYRILYMIPATQSQPSVLVDDTGSASASYTVNNLEPNTAYVFHIVAVNEHGESERSGPVEISTGTPPNSLPVISAGPDQDVPEGDAVSLNGTASDDDGDPLTYLWRQTSGSSPAVVLTGADTLFPIFTAPEVNSDTVLVFELAVYDKSGNSTDTVQVLVLDAPEPAPFVTTWQTATQDESITIPVGGATGTYTVNWGDGTVSADVSGDQTHQYAEPGDHTVSISGDFTRIYLNNHPDAGKLFSIDQWGDTEWSSMNSAFEGATNMAYNAADIPDLSSVADMSQMFWRASSFDGDLSGWNTTSVTYMKSMFRGAASFDGDISTWDASSVTNMRYMFNQASSFDGDISGWDVSSVTEMQNMFRNASSFNGDISGWDVSSVTKMRNMFEGATSFDGDISGWDTASVTDT